MLQELKHFITSHKLFTGKDKILLAVSGGIDSVVLCYLFFEAKINFGIAHCNFKLRGEESDRDELFVQELAKKYGIDFHVKHFTTRAFAEEKNISIQMAARELRYQWFEEIRKKSKYSFIATAHHKGDVAETMLINFVRGTGIHGLHGILPKQNKIIRPLLFTTREEIVSYAKQNNLTHREDSSNASDKYLRNNLRLNIIPELKKINPSLEHSLYATAQQLGQAEEILKKSVDEFKKAAVKKGKSTISISIKKLQQFSPAAFYLFEFLKEFGFNGETTNNISSALKGKSGKLFYSATHSILVNRDKLILQKLGKTENKIYTVNKKSASVKKPVHISLKKITRSKSFTIPATPNIACLDYEKISEKITLRKWQDGDRFIPLGMKGEKKLSDFFIDNRLSLYDKENTWLMLSGNDIVWIVGHRIDDRYKISPSTKFILECKVLS